MWKRSDFICEMKISYVKMFQFRMFFTCERACEIFERAFDRTYSFYVYLIMCVKYALNELTQ